MFKKYLSALLALAILLCGLPGALAEEDAQGLVSTLVEQVSTPEPSPEASAPSDPGPQQESAPTDPPDADAAPGPSASADPEAEETPAPAGASADETLTPEADATAEPDPTAEPAGTTEPDPTASAAPEAAPALTVPAPEAGTAPAEGTEEAPGTAPEDAETETAPVEPEAVYVKNLVLGVKQSAALEVQVLPEGAATELRYASSAPKIAAVSAAGVVVAKARGTAKITVMTGNGIKAVCKVTVKNTPNSIRLNVRAGVLGVGETYGLRYALTKGTAAAVAFYSSDESIVTVDPQTGDVTAVSAGAAVVTARTHNGKKATCRVTVKNAPTEILLSAAELTLGVSQTVRLGASVNEGAAGRIQFASTDEHVLAVDGNGTIRALGVGTAEVVASTYKEGVTARAAVTVLPAPEWVALPRALTLGVKAACQLTPEIPEGAATGYLFKSSNTRVARVTAAGVVVARARGTAKITVVTSNGKKAVCKVTVKNAPKSIRLNASSGVLGVGETYGLRYALTKGTAALVTFASSDESVVTVDSQTGDVAAVSVGAAVITAQTHNGRKAYCQVIVKDRPESISLSASEISLGAGQSAALTAAVNSGAAGRIAFRSSDPGVASVSAAGQIQALRAGTATITASTYVEGVEAHAVVTVLPAPDRVALPARLSVALGDGLQLEPVIPEGSAAAFQYASSNTRVVKVSAGGWLYARGKGTAVVAVKTHNGRTASCRVTVVAAPTRLTLSQNAVTLGVGETHALSAVQAGSVSGTLSFTTSDPSVAAVDAASGQITAVGLGQAEITAATYNGLRAVCQVQVEGAPDSVAIPGPAAREIGAGQTLELAAELPAGTHSAIRWVSSDPAVAQVDANGRVTGLAGGTATITAETYIETVRASVVLTVRPAPESVRLPETAIRLQAMYTYRLAPILPDGAYTVFSYATSDASVASVDADGLVTARAYGQARITVTTHNGKTATLDVEVFDPYRPTSISVGPLPDLLAIGQQFALSCTLLPESAAQDMLWQSAEPAIASVDASGVITALSPGMATVIGVSPRNSEVRLECTFVVLSEQVCLIIPERRTDVDGIEANLERIRAIGTSACDELDRAYRNGVIGKAEYTRRLSAVKNAFAMYAFPWMTGSKMLYWKAANSEGGAKDFKPGIVYYGMPYTQTNREYNVSKAVSGGYYTKASGADYYLLNTSKVTSRNYKGNDCSSFVSMAYWGTGSSYSYLNTTQIAGNACYTTISWDQPLRTGDLICRGGKHVVMFLYYCDVAKTQIMIIEQGGGEEGTNTVSCSIRTVSHYRDQRYVIRRLTQY